MDEGDRPSPEVPSNNYAAAWTILQSCCEASVLAGMINVPVVAQLAGAAALGAAECLGIPEHELLRIQQAMAADIAARRGYASALSTRMNVDPSTANDNAAGASADTDGGKPQLASCDPQCCRTGPNQTQRLKLNGNFSDKGA